MLVYVHYIFIFCCLSTDLSFPNALLHTYINHLRGGHLNDILTLTAGSIQYINTSCEPGGGANKKPSVSKCTVHCYSQYRVGELINTREREREREDQRNCSDMACWKGP